MLPDYLEKARRLQDAGEPFVVAIVVRADRPTSAKPGAKAIITADGRLRGWVGGSCAQPTVVREARAALADGKPRLVRLSPPEQLGREARDGVTEVPLTCVSGGTLEIYLEPYLPKPHLVAIGHLPVAQALVALGKPLGFRVSVVSLDALEDGSELFPGADRLLDALDLAPLALGRESYIVVASHGNYDEEAVEAALKTDAGYVALVASKKRAGSVAQYLKEAGLSPERIAQLKCPAGLDLGAATPEEIALAILAEIVQLRRRKPAPAIPLAVSSSEEARDPVCGMMVDVGHARYRSEHHGKSYYFCASGCQRTFDKDPEAFLARK